MIRAGNWKRALVGIALLLLSFGSFSFFWFGVGGIPRILIGLCDVGVGCWKLVNGLAGVIAAPSHQGSLADEE